MYEQLNSKISGDENLAYGIQTEMSELSPGPTSDNYGSTPSEDKTAQQYYVPSCGLVFYIMAFFGFVCSLMMRESLSITIVVMVNRSYQAAETETDIAIVNASDQERCPQDPELEYESGEFNWSRMQEGVLLAAYYCGFVVTQVCGIETTTALYGLLVTRCCVSYM